MTFEAKLFRNDETRRKRFKEAARAMFGSEEGRVVMSMLLAAAHPLHRGQNLTPHDHGQHEVVSVLWCYGSPDSVLTS